MISLPCSLAEGVCVKKKTVICVDVDARSSTAPGKHGCYQRKPLLLVVVSILAESRQYRSACKLELRVAGMSNEQRVPDGHKHLVLGQHPIALTHRGVVPL
jgi:hypothetical protein